MVTALSERAIQISIKKFLDRFARPEIFWSSIPSGGLRHRNVALKLKQEGLKPGIPDLMFLLPDGKTAWMELKKPKTGRLSPDQVIFSSVAARLGHEWAMCRSLDEAVDVLNKWGVLQPGVKVAA